MSTTGEYVVECRDVKRHYSRSRRSFGPFSWGNAEGHTVEALSGVELDVEENGILGVSGPSGSGKSTLLHLMAGLEPPTEGTVRICGEDTSRMSENERARLRLNRVGIVFQRFRLLPSLSALSNVAMPLVEKGVRKRERRDRAEAMLEDVGLEDRIRHKPAELSGGEQQRVAIARAVAPDPDIVIADEPTGELDTETGRRILDIFERLSEDHAVVIASHDAETISIADRVVEMRDGEIENIEVGRI